MKKAMLVFVACLLAAASGAASAAATAETAKAAKAAEKEAAARGTADAAKAEAQTAEEEEARTAAEAAEAAKKAAEAAKKAAEAKKARAKAAEDEAKARKEEARRAAEEAAKRGARPCEEWQQERAGKSSKSGPAVAWFTGYLAGLAVGRSQDFLGNLSDKKLFGMVDDYCNDHPYEYVNDAAIQLYLDLARKKGMLE